MATAENEIVCPTRIVGSSGATLRLTGSAARTVTSADALPPLRDAVTVDCPIPVAVTGKSAKDAPAVMTTSEGTAATSGSLDVSMADAGSAGPRLTVTRRTPEAPRGSRSVAGDSAVTAGGGA